MSELIDLHLCLQGEGRDMGTPAILVRFSCCNLTCQFKDGFCDSSYASWFPEKGKYKVSDIEELIIKNPQISYAFITGGNPSLDPKLLQVVVNLFRKYGYYIAIEDNGTSYKEIVGLDFVSLSPKLKNSTPCLGTVVGPNNEIREVTEKDIQRHEQIRTRYESIKKWIHNYDHQLKFVISEEEQIEEMENLLRAVDADPNKVYLMPEGINREQLDKRRKWLVELCIIKGYKYTDRLHIVTYDNKRES